MCQESARSHGCWDRISASISGAPTGVRGGALRLPRRVAARRSRLDRACTGQARSEYGGRWAANRPARLRDALVGLEVHRHRAQNRSTNTLSRHVSSMLIALSISLGVEPCIEAVEEAWCLYGRAEIFNPDQGRTVKTNFG